MSTGAKLLAARIWLIVSPAISRATLPALTGANLPVKASTILPPPIDTYLPTTGNTNGAAAPIAAPVPASSGLTNAADVPPTTAPPAALVAILAAPGAMPVLKPPVRIDWANGAAPGIAPTPLAITPPTGNVPTISPANSPAPVIVGAA